MRKVLILSILALAGCTSASDTHKALEAQGFSNVQPGGYDWFACSKDDWYHTKFTATNPQGKQVAGVVCSGLLFKAATVRW